MRISPNFQDANKIKKMYAAGIPVGEISRKINVEAGAVQRHIDTCGQFDKKEMSPQQRGAITRKENAAKAAFDNLSAADPEQPSIMEQDDGYQDQHQAEL